MSKNEENLYILAKSYFDLKEYDRCFHLLGSCTSSLPVFLRTYSQYLSIEKLKQETMGDIFGIFYNFFPFNHPLLTSFCPKKRFIG